MINEDTRRYRIETDRNKLAKFKQNQDVQKFLKDQMVHIEANKKHNLQRRDLDAIEVMRRAKDHNSQMKQKIEVKRSML